MGLTKTFIGACLILFSVGIVFADWRHESIGNVIYTHYYYEGEKLQGICVASEEGVIALLDPADGKIVWRNYPVTGRRLQRFLTQDRCIFLY